MTKRTKMGRPPMPKAERRVRVQLRLPPKALAALDALAKRLGLTRTGAVENLIARDEQ